jgi:RNA polymerase sigma-54 factor
MLKQTLNQKLLQKLSPQQIQFVQLLQLNTTEIANRVEEELVENAALEQTRTDSEDGEPITEVETQEADDKISEEDALLTEVESFDNDISEYLSNEDDYESYTPDYFSNEERKDIPVATYNTLYDILMEQIYSVELNDRQRIIAKHLIGMIEEDGYLRRPLKNVAYDLAFINNIQTDETELGNLLNIIQNFEPEGIGARDLQECLLIQLQRKDDQNKNVLLAKKIISENMNELANKHYDKLMKHLQIDKTQLKDAIDIITHLNPKPGESQINFKTQYIIPDFIVTQLSDGEFEISLNSSNAPQLRVNKSFQEKIENYSLQKKKDKQLKQEVQFIKQKLDNAKWFIEAIRQRQQTLLMTMSTIVQLQKEFFQTGDFTKLRPMILKNIADRISMDISTVSRVVSSKYVQTDVGIFSLRDFFSEGIMKDDGHEVSNREVKRILKEMIGAESKRRPLTDEKLTTILNEKGYNIARRTVAKYREQMEIAVARLRKEL